MPAKQRLTFAAIAVLIAVVAIVVLAGSGGSSAKEEAQAPARTPGATIPQEPEADAVETATPTPTPEVPRIRVRGGEPVGGLEEVRVEEGERIRFTVTSDAVDHVHLHGYDVMRDVGPGQRATFDVEATITGVFEAELEDRGVPIAEVRVEP